MAGSLMRATLVASALLFSNAMFGQSFNIDIDIGFGDPGLGNGAPSSTFGGAAEQQGHWNRSGYGGDPQVLSDLNGNATAVQMSYKTGKAGSGGGRASRFEGNTGDYALLLNDAVSVAPLLPGGELTYSFNGLLSGPYRVYTYAVNINGNYNAVPIKVFGGEPEIETVTGPMPGNAFEHLITHSIHDVNVGAASQLRLHVAQPPNSQFSAHLNGFQLVMVPELNSGLVIGFGILLLALCREKHRLKKGRR
jgi:hypothetical protein